MSTFIFNRIVDAVFERKLEDFWIGAYWKSIWIRGKRKRMEIWICIIPCFPLHITIWNPTRKGEGYGN